MCTNKPKIYTPDMIEELTKASPLRKYVRLRISSNTISEYLEACAAFPMVERLVFETNQDIDDFVEAIISQLSKFKVLKKLEFLNLRADHTRVDYVSEAAEALSEVKGLELMAFENFQIDSDELKTLQAVARSNRSALQFKVSFRSLKKK